jgi:hypothetical protein
MPGEGTFTYPRGTVVNLVAATDEGYHFISWVGDADAIAGISGSATTITMDGAESKVVRSQDWAPRHDMP